MTLVQSRHRPAARGITGLSEAVVDLSAVSDNVRSFRKRVPRAVPAVVKADTFGRGAVPVAQAAVEVGAIWLGHVDVDVSVSTVADLQHVVSIPSVHSGHLKLDTGSYRAGGAPDLWIELTRTAARYGSRGEPTAAEWAEWCSTIPHDIYCGIGSRVRRSYE